jgi:hypothetical protein
LLSQDPQAAGQLGLRLPVEGSVSFFQGVRILLQGALLFYLATRTQGGAETAAANPAWQRLLMQSQYDETARAMLSHFGVGDFNQPAGLQSLATLSWWQRLATPFGRVERNAEGQPVVFVPGALLRPGGLFRGYLLRLLLELRLRSFYAQERVEATNAGQVSAWGWWSRSWHRIGMALAPAGYLAAQLGNDHSLLARQLRPGGELSGVYSTWARFPTAQNSRVLLSGMVYAASAGTQTEREAAARTLLNLLAAMPAWGSTMAGTWQISGKDLFLPVWLINAGPRVLPGKILKLMETLPLNIDYQKLAPGRRLENRFDQAA